MYAVVLRPMSIHLSQAGVLPKRPMVAYGLVFCCRRSWRKSYGITPNWGAKSMWGDKLAISYQ